MTPLKLWSPLVAVPPAAVAKPPVPPVARLELSSALVLLPLSRIEPPAPPWLVVVVVGFCVCAWARSLRLVAVPPVPPWAVMVGLIRASLLAVPPVAEAVLVPPVP